MQFDHHWRSPEALPHRTYCRPTQAAFPYEWLVLDHVSQLPKSYQISNSWLQGAPGPALAAAISACFIAQAGYPRQNTGGAGLGLHHPGNPRVSTPSGQLQTTSEHHHPVPCTADPPQGAEFGGQWSQPVLAAD